MEGFAAALARFKTSPEFRASESAMQAIQLEYETRDLVLQPIAELSAETIKDDRESYSSVVKDRTDTLGLGLSKAFSTGTTVRFEPSWERAMLRNATPRERNTVDWEVGITQSLWRDAFGRGTRLRWDRQDHERREQLARVLGERAQLLINFETLYWEWALAIKEGELRSRNVKRGQEILRWVRARLRRAAAESTDLLQARTHLTSLEIQLAAIQQKRLQAAAQMERFVPGSNWRPDAEALAANRAAEGLLADWPFDEESQNLRLELLRVRNASRAADVRAREVRESIRPELNLELAYGRNAIDGESTRALRESYEEDHPYTSVGVVFRTGLDVGGEYKKVAASRALAESARQKTEALEAESKVAWQQLRNDIQELQARTAQARELVNLQVRKADEERRRYEMGKTTAFQAITFEQEAAEAEVDLWYLYAELRKTEAKARLFAR